MLKRSRLEFKIPNAKFNFDLLTSPNVRSAMAKNQDKAGLPPLANRCETMSPTKPKYEWITLGRKPNKKTRRVTAPKTFTPHGSQSSDDKLWRKCDRERTFYRWCFRIATALNRASRARLICIINMKSAIVKPLLPCCGTCVATCWTSLLLNLPTQSSTFYKYKQTIGMTF